MIVHECDGCGTQARTEQQRKTFRVLTVTTTEELLIADGDSRLFCQTCMDKIGRFVDTELRSQ
jgi:hypothetical protein